MEEVSYSQTDKKPSLIPSIRFLLACLAFLLTAIQYMQRINMSVAIVCMVNNTYLTELNKKNVEIASKNSLIQNSNLIPTQNNTNVCLFSKNSKSQKLDGEFLWQKDVQGLILSSFFYGYLLTQIAGAWLSLRFGPKIVLEISILIASIFTLLTPLAAHLDYKVLILCRFIIGFVHGVVWPALGSLWPFWAPPAERSTILGFASAGSQIGNVVTLPLGGFLCIYGGWATIFYSIGALGIIWCILWFIFVTDSPKTQKFISQKEKAYILNETKEAVNVSNERKTQKTPWLDIIKSKAFYALLITHTCSNFGTYLFLTQLPTYMSEILNFDIKSNGALSALPYLGFWLFTILSGILSDLIIKTGKLSRKAVRKIFNTIGFMVPMGAVIGLIFVSCRYPYYGVALVTAGLAFSGFTYGAGFLVNYNDIGGAYSGLVFGIVNTIGSLSGIIAPYLVGVLTKNKLQSEWQIVFAITAGVYLVGGLAFVLLASAETQTWAIKKNSDIDEEETVPMK